MKIWPNLLFKDTQTLKSCLLENIPSLDSPCSFSLIPLKMFPSVFLETCFVIFCCKIEDLKFCNVSMSSWEKQIFRNDLLTIQFITGKKMIFFFHGQNFGLNFSPNRKCVNRDKTGCATKQRKFQKNRFCDKIACMATKQISQQSSVNYVFPYI